MSICSTASPDPLKANAGPKSATGPPLKRCFTVNEWCAAYCLSRTRFYELVAAGELKVIKLAGRTLITVEEAERFLARAVEAAS
jgi:hypothetical protein